MAYKMTEEHKRKLREANLGKKHNISSENRKKLSELKKGKQLSKETRKAISEGHKKFYSDEENKKRLCEWLKGHKCSEETKRKISESRKDVRYTQGSKEKISESLKEYFKTEDEEHLKRRLEKAIYTKRTNNTFNTSKPEENAHKLLKEKYPKVCRQYSSEVYPFACDFYIMELDLYIECHFGWMHGGKPFDSEEDVLYIKWKQKSMEKPIYKQALYTWTDLDVRKLKTFRKNKLNYKIFYTFEEFINWYNEKEKCDA